MDQGVRGTEPLKWTLQTYENHPHEYGAPQNDEGQSQADEHEYIYIYIYILDNTTREYERSRDAIQKPRKSESKNPKS